MDDTISPICETISKPEQGYDFSTLPPHVLASILSHLELYDFKNALQTCKSWYYASCDPKLAAKLYLHFKPQGPSGDMQMFVRPVTKIRFNATDLTKFDYKMLLKNLGHQITELHINDCVRLRNTQLFEMFIYLTNLKILRLEDGHHYYKPKNFYKHGRITKYKARIKENLSRVQELHIKANETDMKGAEILVRYCTNLKTLYWNEFYTEFIKTDTFLHEVLLDRNSNCISECLENLTVHSLDWDQNSKFFEQLASLKRTKLRSLHLKDIKESYYDVMFQKFCEAYKLLENLNLSACNDHHLADICKFMLNLKTLHLDGVTATYLRPIGYLKKLESLTLYHQIEPTDDSLIDLFCTKLKNLKSLTLIKINSVVLKELCENLPHLQHLWLRNINTHDCEPIYRHMTKLKAIHLEFTEIAFVNSKYIESHPEWNVLKLIELEEVFATTFVPGLTPDLIVQLPKLKQSNHTRIYDAPEQEDLDDVDSSSEDIEEDDNQDQDRNEHNIIEDGEIEDHDDEVSDEEGNDDVIGADTDDQTDHEEDNGDEENQDDENEENEPNDQDDQDEDDVTENDGDDEEDDDNDHQSEEEEYDADEVRIEYHLTEFKIFSSWFCEIATEYVEQTIKSTVGSAIQPMVKLNLWQNIIQKFKVFAVLIIQKLFLNIKFGDT